MSPVGVGGATRVKGFPRVSGDEPQWGVLASDALRFSPRERG